jgi:sporulation protein YlmC with PRC-barrel domain
MKRCAAFFLVAALFGLEMVWQGTLLVRETMAAEQTTAVRSTSPETWKNQQGLREASTILRARVTSTDGRQIGEIDQLLIDPRDGRVTHAVIGMGGFLAERQVVVPWSQVRLSGNQPGRRGHSSIIMDPDILERAPRYTRRAGG